MYIFTNYQGPDMYSAGSGERIFVYIGNPSNDFSQQVGFVDLNGNVYKGSPGNDRSSRIGYVDQAGRIYKGTRGSDYSSAVGYIAQEGPGYEVFVGHPGSEYVKRLGDIYIRATDKHENQLIYNFCGACLLLALIEAAEKEMAVCPRCGNLRVPGTPVEIRICQYCGYLYPPT